MGRPSIIINKNEQDLSVAEVEQIHDKVDGEIKKNGMPTEEDLKKEIEKMNKTL